MINCPDCGGEAGFIGPIHNSYIFAGRSHDLPIPGGSLYRCSRCGLGFRWPRLTKSQLNALYRQGKEENWARGLEARRDWLIAQEVLEPLLHTDSKVLDVGCWDGGFLASLTSPRRRYGIEIHPSASEAARKKGIEITAEDWADMVGVFDFVTSFDVIEHVERPKIFLTHCLGAVRQRGYVLISTGNLDALTFRLMGGRYWYCTIAEHISFVSPRWFHHHSKSLNYKVVKQSKFVHGDCSALEGLAQAASNVIYRFNPKTFSFLRRIGFGALDLKAHPDLVDHPPGWGAARDHFLVVVQKQ